MPRLRRFAVLHVAPRPALLSALRAGLSIAVLATVAACGGGDGSTRPPTEPPDPPGPPPVQPGTLTLSATGLPEGLAPALSASGPLPAATFQRTTAAPVTWTDVPAGRYTIDVATVRGTAGRFAGDPASFEVTVSAGGPAVQAQATYRPLPSAILVETDGLPNDAPSALAVTAPGGEAASVAARTVLVAPQATDASAPDQWRVEAGPVLHQGSRYTPLRLAVDTVVPFGDTARVHMPYAIATGSVAVVVSGLPNGLEGAVRLLQGDSLVDTFTGTRTVVGLEPGTYRLVALPVTNQQTTFRAVADTQAVEVTASAVAAPATVRYAAQVGRLQVSVSGLPSGVSAALTLSGNGLEREITGSTTLDSLPEGTYELSAAGVTVQNERYAPTPVTQTVRINTDAQTAVSAQYGMVPTVVDIPVTGLPGNVPAKVTVVGPDGELYNVTESRRVVPARPGRWRLSATGVSHALGNFTAAPATRDTVVSPGDTLRLPVHYTITTGSLAVAIVGLPDGAAGSVAVSGPGGYSRVLTTTTTLTALTPGTYAIWSNLVVHGGVTYAPTQPTQTVTVSADVSATPATVAYAGGFGSLIITATGAPPSGVPVYVLTSAGQTSRVVNGTGTVTGLAAATWTVTAQPITTIGGTVYTPTPASQQATVPVGGQTSVNFSYGPSGGEDGGGSGPNYRIAYVHLTQAIQRLDGSMPLVANREALLRVFVTAAQANSERPDVVVRLYDGATLIQSTTIPAPEGSVRTAVAEGVLGSTWNMLVPAEHMRPNLRVQVELDPARVVPDSNRTDNVWPLNGTQPIAVYNVPTFNVRFVPVNVGGLTGNVSEANKEQYLVSARRMFPLRDVFSDVRAPFTSSATVLQSGDANGHWLTVLSEMNALRSADGAPITTHYYGVLKVNYTSGIAGYGYVPGRAAIGWDHLPSGDLVAAHEWGHNFNRPHAPCGVAGELAYPYPGAIIGHYGWNSATGTLVPPTATDLMSYCSNNWISDYTWNLVMQFRSTAGVSAAAMAADEGNPGTGEGLLVWGRVRNGQILLEPAFRVRAPATRVTGAATHRLDLLDPNGATLLSTPLETSEVDHVPGGEERQFAMVVPWSAALEQRLSALRVQDVRVPTRSVLRRSARAGVAAEAADAPAAAVETRAGRAVVRWSPSEASMALVTDAATGQIMGFVRRPGDAVVTGGRAVQVQLSDGVRSRNVR